MANCIMHRRSQWEPKKSIYRLSEPKVQMQKFGKAYLWLKQGALEQNKRLPLELVDQLSKRYT